MLSLSKLYLPKLPSKYIVFFMRVYIVVYVQRPFLVRLI